MIDDRFQRRKAHALQELKQCGVIRARVPLVTRAYMLAFPRSVPPFYGSDVRYGAFVAALIAVPVIAGLSVWIALGGPGGVMVSLWIALAGAAAGGVAGFVAVLRIRGQRVRHGLSDWRDLDHAPGTGTAGPRSEAARLPPVFTAGRRFAGTPGA